jgi:lipoate-protein ligase A
LLDSGPCEPAWNMALDEALLGAVAELRIPVLRFYGWTVPAATFGYFQHYADVEGMTPLRPLIRRPTGGGLVPHETDWTYSLVFPPSHAWYRLRATESYQRLHEWIRVSLAHLQVISELAPESRKELPGRCFAGPEKSDLLREGRKIAGAAQRRTRQGLLIQGSIQPPPPCVTRSAWEKAFCEIADREWDVVWISQDDGERAASETPAARWADSVHQEAHRLAESKYSRPDYNQRR